VGEEAGIKSNDEVYIWNLPGPGEVRFRDVLSKIRDENFSVRLTDISKPSEGWSFMGKHNRSCKGLGQVPHFYSQYKLAVYTC